jgi:hypothetical protein
VVNIKEMENEVDRIVMQKAVQFTTGDAVMPEA